MGKAQDDAAAQDENDAQVEIWKVKSLIKKLESARGNGTSMISLIVPPKSQVSQISKMLSDEYGTASNIKSRVNRLSVLSAITSAQQKLKLYTKVPPNGLVLYTGTVITEEGKEKKMNVDFEPFKPINTSLYLCDNKFHTEPLGELLQSDQRYAFIVMDGNGCLYGCLTGSNREVLNKFSVELPKKHGRGGQSAQRFGRIRMEKRHHYMRKVCETATSIFIDQETNLPNVAGIVLAGSAEFKNELQDSDMFDARLKKIVLAVVDVSYGGENGFSQAIELSGDTLASVKFVQEKKLIGKFFEEIALDSGKFVFGVNDTMQCLDMGAVQTIIVWEDLTMLRVMLKNTQTGSLDEKFLTPEQMKEEKHFRDKDTSAELEVVEKTPMVEFLAMNYKKYGAVLEFVTDKSQEGSQFCRGFGGLGGVLRYSVDLTDFEVAEACDDSSDDDFW